MRAGCHAFPFRAVFVLRAVPRSDCLSSPRLQSTMLWYELRRCFANLEHSFTSPIRLVSRNAMRSTQHFGAHAAASSRTV